LPGSQDFAGDPRNADALVWLNGDLVPKREAKVSIFDAGFVLGDGVWEGLRLHKGRLMFLDAHMDRLYAGAATIGLDIGKTRDELVAALAELFAANGMETGVHIRLQPGSAQLAGPAHHRHRRRVEGPEPRHRRPGPEARHGVGALHAAGNVRHAAEFP
jgi:branched-chain amino acid aminotransferase